MQEDALNSVAICSKLHMMISLWPSELWNSARDTFSSSLCSSARNNLTFYFEDQATVDTKSDNCVQLNNVICKRSHLSVFVKSRHLTCAQRH